MNTTRTQAEGKIPGKAHQEIMTKVQEFASTWAVAGGRFDDGTAMERAEACKAEISALLAKYAHPAPTELSGVGTGQRLAVAAKALADWAEYEVGADAGLTPGLSAIRATLQSHSAPQELTGVAETSKEGDGIWRSCSGCHELNEGHDTGPYSEVFKCHLGGGCRECGGIGAVWDTTDYAAMGDAMARDMVQKHAPQDKGSPSDVSTVIGFIFDRFGAPGVAGDLPDLVAQAARRLEVSQPAASVEPVHSLADEVIIASNTGNLDLITEKVRALVTAVKSLPVSTQPAPDERAAFEWWASDKGESPKAIERNANGFYKLAQTASAWAVWQARAALSTQASSKDEVDAAFEAVRTHLCAIPRYSFHLDDDGLVRRVFDRTGNWIDFDDAHRLFDPVAVDAARAAGGEHA